MIEVRVQSLGIDQLSKTPVVILQEAEGERMLPIWIGAGEASAIAMEISGMKFARPMTHDLAATLISSLGGTLSRVLITRVQDNTYFAEMLVEQGGETISVDARPSDSIAIALRLNARLFAQEELLTATGLQVEPADDLPTDSPPGGEPASPERTAEQLQEYLKKLNPEDLGRFNP